MEPLRIGLLGAARITERAIVRPAHATGHRLIAVAARAQASAERFAERNGVERVLGSYSEVITDPQVEVIYNPLVNGMHGPWNLAAIHAGKHVLGEKPFASNADEAGEVRDAAASAKVTVMEAFHYLYHPVTRRLHELVGSGELGDLRAVEVDMLMPPPPDTDPRWSYDLAGGALMDLGCYGLDAHRALSPWAGGPPHLRSARGRERAGRPGVDEWMHVELEFPDGASGTVRCSMTANIHRFTCRIVGSRGEATAANFVLPHQDDRVTVIDATGRRVEELGQRTSYTFQLEALAANLREGAPLKNDMDDAVATMRLIDAAYSAAGFMPRPSLPPR